MADRPSKSPVQIKGNTMRTYLFLLNQGSSGLIEVQQALGFSTPSLASYHLGKLVEAGYATQDEKGRYMIVWDATKELLDGYVRVGTVVFPQLVFFSILFTAVIGFLISMSLFVPSYVPLLAIASAAVVGAFWYETVRVW